MRLGHPPEKMPRVPCSKIFVADDSIPLLGKASNDQQLLELLPAAIGQHKINFYSIPGRAWTFKDETTLFTAYENVLVPQAKKSPHFRFAGWRGPLSSGGILRHEGQLKATGLTGHSDKEVLQLLWKKIREVFGETAVCEFHIEVF